MRKFITVFVSAVIITASMPKFIAYSEDVPDISAKSAVLISADTGEIVYSLDCNKKMPMASTTKIMTTLLCIESGNLYEEFVVDSNAIKVEGSSMGLQEGDVVTKYALCCGMLLPSGNDAANAAAVKVAGSIEKFVQMMNERALEIGLSRTYFVTPSGLDGKGHGSSAYDMAMLAREALKYDLFREICSSAKIKLSFGNPPYERWLTNTNKLLTMYDGVYGVKTGFTDEAGRCLVSASEKDGKKLICVTLNDKNDWNDHISLYEYGFGETSLMQIQMPKKYELDLVGAKENKMLVKPSDDPVMFTVKNYGVDNFSFNIISPPFTYAPVRKNDFVAELCVICEGKEVKRVPLYADKDYDIYKIKEKDKPNKNLLKTILNKFRSFIS